MSKWIATSRGKTSQVTIYKSKNIVVKQFRGYDEKHKQDRVIKHRGSLNNSFHRELECLKRLKGHDNFPQLIDFDENSLRIEMSYCGEPYPCKAPRASRPELIGQANNIVDALAKVDVKYNYKAVSSVLGKEYIHLQASNITLDDDKMYLIDFEDALPVGREDLSETSYVDRFKKEYTTQEFKKLFKDFLVPLQDPVNQACFDWLGNKRHFKIKNNHR